MRNHTCGLGPHGDEPCDACYDDMKTVPPKPSEGPGWMREMVSDFVSTWQIVEHGPALRMLVEAVVSRVREETSHSYVLDRLAEAALKRAAVQADRAHLIAQVEARKRQNEAMLEEVADKFGDDAQRLAARFRGTIDVCDWFLSLLRGEVPR